MLLPGEGLCRKEAAVSIEGPPIKPDTSASAAAYWIIYPDPSVTKRGCWSDP